MARQAAAGGREEAFVIRSGAEIASKKKERYSEEEICIHGDVGNDRSLHSAGGGGMKGTQRQAQLR